MTTYNKLLKEHGLIEEPLCGINEDGEKVIVMITDTDATVRTIQSNGWHRINIYYPDGTEEELYEK